MFTAITHCRICQGELRDLFTVPAPLVSRFPRKGGDRTPLLSVPLEVVQCLGCEHAQLRHQVDPEYLYQEYWYESGVNERMRVELGTIVRRAQDYAVLEPGDAVLDIGANDGTLLRAYAGYPTCAHLCRVAVEPSETFAPCLCDLCDVAVQGAFPECFAKLPPTQYKVITTVAMFYDLADPVAAASAIRQLLHSHGVWVCQFQDLEQQVRAGAWDNIVHEHLSYHTLGTFNEVVRRAGLQIVDVERTPINGGSLRVFVRHPHAPVNQQAVSGQYYDEFVALDHRWPQRFRLRMERNVGQIRAYVQSVTDRGGVVDLYGASTKGNTLLQVTGLSELVRCAWERNPRKYDRTTVTRVPIINEAHGRATPPDALLTTIWQFRQQILERERETLRTVPLILPLPEATWVRTQPERLERPA